MHGLDPVPGPSVRDGVLTDGARAFLTKIEVLRDLESKVRELMETHEQKRPLWFPSELLGPPPGADPDRHVADLRSRAAGIPDSARAALALNMLTEEGLPHFHRLLAVYLGDDSHWRDWKSNAISIKPPWRRWRIPSKPG